MTIHPSAVVHPDAAIGADAVIGPLCRIESDVRIGEGCRLEGHVTVLPFTEVGDQCHIHPGAVIGGPPQDLAFDPATRSRVRIGDRCVIREGVTIHRGTGEGTETVVGDDCFLMANSHVAHNGRLGDRVILVNGALVAGHAEVGDAAIISGNAVIHQFCRIGRLVMMGGLSGVSKDVPPFAIVDSGETNRVAGINVVGLRRAGFGAKERTEIKQAFRLLYHAGLTVSDAVVEIRRSHASPAVEELCAFVESSKRGICGHRREGPRGARGRE